MTYGKKGKIANKEVVSIGESNNDLNSKDVPATDSNYCLQKTKELQQISFSYSQHNAKAQKSNDKSVPNKFVFRGVFEIFVANVHPSL